MTLRILMMLMCPFVSLLAAGCNRQQYVSDERLTHGWVLVFTGIEGRSTFNEAIVRGLAEGGVDSAIELVDWTSRVPGPGYLYNLRAEDRNRRKAAELADRVIQYRIRYPGRPVVLIGQSGGGAMAVWTAEAIPFGQKVDGVICLAATLSPEYMLDIALEKSSRGIVNFYSRNDWLFLGLGTELAGTMDGQHSSSAGRVGFSTPRAGGAPPCYDKLFQVAWHEKMLGAGHYGGHLSSGASDFVARFVAPLVMADKWNQQLIGEVLSPAAGVAVK
jgi:pimeloyl-ACP methyl ester carboxylesterase